MMDEIWKTIKDFPRYEISNLGRVRSWKGRGYLVRKLYYDKLSGYVHLGLFKNSMETKKYVHILVLEAFVGDYQPSSETKWKDGDRTNNELKNLMWIARTKNPHRRKLTDEDVLNVKKLLHLGVKRRLIADKLGVTYQAIRDIDSGKCWFHIKHCPTN